MPPGEPWISQAVVPGLSFSSITQRAWVPSGPRKVAGPAAGAVAVGVVAVGVVADGLGLAAADCGLCSCDSNPAMATAIATAVIATPEMITLFGSTLPPG